MPHAHPDEIDHFMSRSEAIAHYSKTRDLKGPNNGAGP